MANSDKKLDVMFIPDWTDGNPYQLQLAESLTRFNVSVSYLNSSLLSLFGLAVGREHTPSVIHIHWLDKYALGPTRIKTVLKASLTLLCLKILKYRNRKIVYTVHNLESHENVFPVLEKYFYRRFFNLVDDAIVHCNAATSLVAQKFGKIDTSRFHQISHGNYIGLYPPKIDQRLARDQYKMDARDVVFLFVGQIRPYKGVLELIEAFASVADKNARLLIAGRVTCDHDVLRDMAGKDDRIILKEGFVSNEELSVLLSAADVFVAPFKKVLTSGSVILAMSYELPCVAPRVGCLPETLQEQDILQYDPSDPTGLAMALHRSIELQSSLMNFGSQNLHYAETRLSWETVGMQTANVYRKD